MAFVDLIVKSSSKSNHNETVRICGTDGTIYTKGQQLSLERQTNSGSW